MPQREQAWQRDGLNGPPEYTRSPLEDSRLFGSSPWKILATTHEQKRFLSNPAPGENLLSGNLVMETGCTIPVLAALGRPESLMGWVARPFSVFNILYYTIIYYVSCIMYLIRSHVIEYNVVNTSLISLFCPWRTLNTGPALKRAPPCAHVLYSVRKARGSPPEEPKRFWPPPARRGGSMARLYMYTLYIYIYIYNMLT